VLRRTIAHLDRMEVLSRRFLETASYLRSYTRFTTVKAAADGCALLRLDVDAADLTAG
jgi:hypothetical protein